VSAGFVSLLAAWLGGAAATYLFDDDAPLPARLALGGPLGLAVFGLAGFAAALGVGLGPSAVLVGSVAAASPLLALRDSRIRGRLKDDVRALRARPGRAEWIVIAGAVAAAVLVWQVTERAVIFEQGGIGTGVDHNLGDLPFHLAITTGFAYGGNLPPEHPELAGVRLTYPFLVDFVAAMVLEAGATLRSALFLEGMMLGLCLVALLYRWGFVLTQRRLAALITPALFLFSGGMGWTLLFRDVRPEQEGLVALLGHLTHNYTILPNDELRWGNVVTTLLVPQRTLLMGLPLALGAVLQWWQALDGEAGGPSERAGRRRMAAAGVMAGMLPLVHGHSLAVVMASGACLALLFPRRTWLYFFAPAAALALPQVLWMAAGTGLRASRFVGWHVGWDRGEQDPLTFWLWNTGLFIPLLGLAFLWRSGGTRLVSGRHVRFYVPFALCFALPNLFQLSPWIWDNIKFLVYWYVASVPIVAVLLAHLWRRGSVARAAALAGFVLLTLAGALDVWRVVSRAETHLIFDAAAVGFSRHLREVTPPRALVLHVPTYRSPVFLAGRRSLLGYPGHIWSQGLDSGTREADITRMYAGESDAPGLLRRYGVDYVMYGPEEASAADEEKLADYPLVLATGRYHLYDVRGRPGGAGP